MAWSDEAEQGFPPKRHKEPLALRQDILDELADHLALAAEREVESGTNTDHEIRNNVLEKFGNPTAIAHALWWDAMKGTVMKDWIQIIVNIVLCIGVMAFMTVFYRNMQASNTALLGALNQLNTPLTEQQDPKVEFILHRGSIDGPLAEEVPLYISGAFFNTESSILRGRTDQQGNVEFGPIAAGNHNLSIKDPVSGLSSRQSFTVYKGDGTKTVHIAIPSDIPTPIDAWSPLAQNDSIRDLMLLATMTVSWDQEGEHWFEGELTPTPRRRYSGPKSNKVLITKDGVFLVHDERIENKIKAGKPLTQVYGNELMFSNARLVSNADPDDASNQWLVLDSDRYGSQMEFSFGEVFLLEPGKPFKLSLELSDSLLKAYNHNRRYGLNQNHGLPDSFGWFTSWVTSRYENYIIDSAALVEHSGRILNYESKTSVTDSRESTTIMRLLEPDPGWQAQRYSLKNAPKSIPEGYKLLLGFGEGAKGRIHSTDPVLNAYLDQLPQSFDAFDNPQELDAPPPMDSPIWSMSSAEIADDFGKITLFDLTDSLNAVPDLENYNGIFFSWDKPSKNELRFSIPEGAHIEHQPVWILLKPYPEVATQ